MGKPEDLLNINSKNVFAQPLLQDASLLNEVASLGIEVSTRSGKVKKSSLDPIAKAGTDDLSLQPLPTKPATPLNSSPTVFGSIPDGSTVKTSAADVDPVTGNPGLTPLANAIQAAPPAAIPVTLPAFAVMAEGTVTVNGSSDFDGDPRNLKDDALIYGGAGFTINGNPTLPIQRDANGNPILDAKGKPQLVKEAVAVAPDYRVSNASGNHYAGLIPPSVVPKQVVSVTAYADIRQHELTRRIPLGTPTVFFNAQQNPINNANDWAKKFPTPGTAANPTVVQVTNGGLTIPSGVNLSHTIITVANGDINFNGSGQTLNNTVLVTNNGNVNLAKVRSTDLSVLAAGAINMNGGAKFGGSTLLANETGGITFNGSTSTTDSGSNLAVISQGNITYNGSSNTRGIFLSAKDFTYNGSSTLYGAIGAKGNVLFNGRATVIADATISLRPTPPAITAGLTRDTAPGNTANTDRITYDPTIAGTVSVTNPGIQIGASGTIPANGSSASGNQIIEFKARFDSMPTSSYRNILSSLQANGTFNLSRTELNQIYGNSLTDGPHTLHLLARDQYNNVTNVDIVFTLDTRTAAPILTLQPTSDSGQSNQDRITNVVGPTIRGTAEAGASLEIFNGNQSIGQTTVAADGTWQFTTPQLDNGIHTLSAIATDIAGNTNTSTTFQITVDSVLPQVSLTPPIDQAPLRANARLTGVTDGTGSAIVALRYHFNDRAEIDLAVSANGSFDQAIDFTGISNGHHILTLTALDVAGNLLTTRLNVTVALDDAAPVITAQLVRDTAPGGENSDRITFDPTITGTLTDASQVVSFRAGFDEMPVGQFVEVIAQRQADGSFTFDRATLNQIYGDTLPDGLHRLHLQARDEFDNLSSLFTLSFTLDTVTPAPSNLQLTPGSDSGQSNRDGITRINAPTITGNAEAGALIELFAGPQQIGVATANAEGFWQMTTAALANGVHQLTAIATDIAGNVSFESAALTVVVDVVPPQVSLTTPVETVPLTQNATLVGAIDGTGSAIVALSYRFDTLPEIGLGVSAAGEFDQAIDFSGVSSGAHTLTLTATDVAGNRATLQFQVTVDLDTTGPVIAAELANDTAPDGTNRDRVTSDPTVSGTLADASQVVEFQARFAGLGSATDVLADRQADGSFTFNRDRLEQIYGGALTDGQYSLQLEARDQYGNVSQLFELSFVLDTTLALSIALDPAFDSAPVGDSHTTTATVSLSGLTEAGATVQLLETGATVTADSSGQFSFSNVALVLGENRFTVEAIDVAGNRSTSPLSITRLATNRAPTDIFLSQNWVAENSLSGTVIGQLTTLDPDAADTHTYRLLDNAGGRFQLVGHQVRIAPGAVLDFESSPSYSIQVRTTDSGSPGLFFDKTLTIDLTDVNEAPRFTSSPVLNAEVGTPYRYAISTVDPEGNQRTITAKDLPSWLTLVDNGDGTASLNGSPTTAQSGLYPIQLTATDAGGLQATQTYLLGVDVILREGANFSPTQAVTFKVDRPSILSFTFDPTFDLTDLSAINDAFEVALVDAGGRSLVHTIAQGRDAFFNLTEGEPTALAVGATYSTQSRTVTLNLTGIPTHMAATLVFRLVNDDGDITTSVRVRDITLSDAPLGMQPQTGTVPGTARIPAPITPDKLSVLEDISSSIQADYRRTTFNAQTKLLYADVAVTNSGTYSVDAPLLVAISNISDPSVLVRDPDGFTPTRLPYYNFSALVADGKLDPAELTSTRALIFYNPNQVQFTYDLVVLAQLNQGPTIQTLPVREVLGGQPYLYDVNATDPNGDMLTYQLLSAPQGMTIDAQSGVISWHTEISDRGSHAVLIQVSDNRGGITKQSFTLSVTEELPNRPPIFTSTPAVDAFIGQRYAYDADAVDPDQDNPLTYDLISGPDGMTVDPSTGLVYWTPPPALILGDTVLGRINVPGEIDEFTFSGAIGQRLYFDPLQYSGSHYDWRMDVYSPSGIKVIDAANFAWDQNKLITLTEDGTYRTVVRTVGDKVGSYGFSVINLSLVPVVPFDVVVKGQLSPGSEDDVFRFTGNRGQKLFFDQLSKSGDFDWVLYDANNQVVQSSYYFSDMEVNLPSNGEYVLTLRGRSGFSSTADYAFSIVTPDLITTPITLGNVVSGTIGEKGEQDIYTFTGSIGQRLFLDVLTYSGSYYSQRLYLYSPSGVTYLNRYLTYGDEGPFTLTEAGTYRLVIDASGEDTGSYSFNLLDVGQATPISLDVSQSGQLSPGQETHLYTFTGNTGQILFFDSMMNSSGSWTLYDSGNQRVDGTSLRSDFEVNLSQSGTYTLVLQGDQNKAINYQFQIITPEISTTELTLGSTVSGTISEKGEQDIYTFTGSVGQRLYLDVLTYSSSYSQNLYLYSPSGVVYLSRSLGSGDTNPFTLKEDGTYRLVVDGAGENTGSYSFSLLDVEQATPVELDVSQSGQLSPGQETHLYTFTGNAGQRLYFDSMMNSSGSWALYNSGNQQVEGTNLNSDFEVILSQTDTYTLVLQGNRNSPIDYQFQIITPETTTADLILGNSISGTIAEKGEQDVYTFTGSIGQRLFLDVLAYSGNHVQKLYLYSPSGVIYLDRSLSSGDAAPFTLTEAGIYRLVIDGAGESTGSYSFNLLDVGQATPISLDVSQSGQLSPGQETHLYTFEGNARQRLFFDSMMNSSGSWTLYNSGNQRVDGTSLNSDFEVTLSQLDTYTLVLQGNRSEAIDYQFQVITPTVNTVELTLGNTVSGAIGEKGEQDIYTFIGNVGQQLFLDVLTYSGSYAQSLFLYSPSGVVQLNRYLSSGDSVPFTLTESGTYRLVVDGVGENTGSYSFRMADLAAASDLALDTPTNDDLLPQAVRFYQLKGTPGQRLQFDSLSAVPGADWVIYGPGNFVLGSAPLSNDFEVELISVGTHFLAVRNSSNNAVSYSIQVNTLPSLSVENTGLGIIHSGVSASTPTSKSFTAAAGTLIYFDGQGTSSGVYARLSDPKGDQIFNINAYRDSGSILLRQSGAYTLQLTGNGSYQYRVIDLGTAKDLVLNTVTNVTLSPITATTAYKFTGTFGQQLYYDALNSNYPNVSVRLVTPSGRELFNSSAQDDQNLYQTLTLDEAGTFYLLFSGSQSAASSVSFRLFDKAQVQSITLDQEVTGRFTNSRQSDLYRFAANAGQYMYVNQQAGGSPNQWYLFGPGGLKLSNNTYYNSNYIYTDQEFTLSADGEYLLVMRGNGSSNLDYKFTLVTPEFVTQELPLNQTVSGTLSEPGENDIYTFTGAVGQQLFFDALNSNSPGFTVRVYSPTNQQVYSSAIQNDFHLGHTFTLAESGNYRLIIDGDGDAIGNYSFRLLNKAEAQLIALDQEVIGRFANSRQSDLYRFMGNAGQYLYVNQQAGNYPNEWYLFGPGGLKVLSTYIYNDKEFTLPADGEYLLVMRGNGSSNQDYKFTLVTPEFVTQALPLNQTVNGTLSKPGENDIYTFSGTVGQQLFFDALNSSSPGFTVRVYSPTNQQVYSSAIQDDWRLDRTFMLAESGTYRLVIDGNDDRVGEYKFRLLDKAAAALITLDQEVIGRFPDSRQSDLYRFTGSTGQYVYVNQQVGGSPNQWYLFGPGGLRVSSEYIYNDQEFALPADGEYWLVMRGNGSSNLNYKFTLVTPEFSTQNLSLNQTISGTLTEPGENDTYTFNGAIGQQLFFDALNSNSPGFTVRLYSPTNQQVYSSAIQSDWRLDRTFVLSESGTYRLVIDGDGDRTGDYSFRLLDKAAATLINLDQEVTGKFTDSRQSDLYRFTGSTGQYMYVNQQMGSSNEWYLFGPGGLKVSSDQIYDDQEFVLPADGEYLLVMQGKGYTPSDYQFTLVTPEFVTQALPLNQVISGTLTEPGENDTYTFSGAIGQQLFFDALSATYFRAKLYDPIGREVFNLDSRYDRGPSDGLLLSMNGTYRVVIDGVGDRTGDYKFRLLDKAAATVVSFNTEGKGTFEQDGIGSELYRFTGVAGQSIYLDTGSGQYPNSWILYGPGGQHISNGYVQDNYNYSYADDYEFTLPATGEYLLVMQGKGAVNVNFKFKLVTPETLSTSLTIGTLVTGNISNAGEQDIYTFDGIVGQQLYFDALKGNSNLKARLIGPGGAVVLDKNTNGDWGGFNLTETGTYRLLIDGEKATTGEYSFILSDRALSPALTLDTAIAGSLNPGNQAKLYQFTGKTGQRLKFALEAASWNGANWVLYNPSGGIAKAPTASSPDFAATIGADGLYTLAILGNSSAPISYSFKVTDLQAEQITNTGLNTIQSGSLSAGQVNDYSFSATAGTLIYLDSHTNSSTWYLRTRLLNPDGTFVFNNEDARNNRGPILLEQSGTYTLQTYGTYSNTIGNYQFNLLELPRDIASPNPNALRIGEINTENLSSRQSKVYIFEGAIGEKFALNALVGQNVKATVYDPNGSQLFSNSLYWYGDSNPLTLSQSGLYYLVVENYDTASQNYSFQLLNISNLPEIRYGLPVSGSLKNGQENHFYKLQAQAGERLFFDHLTTTAPNSNFRWKLFGPSNNLLFNTALQSDFEFAIPTTGDYYLKIEGGNTAGKVDYSFRVLRHTPAIRDVITPGTGETVANAADSLGLLPVQLSVKDAKGASSVQDFKVKLWADPDNGNPVITSIPETRFSLADKIYRYQLKSLDPDGDDLSYRLLEAPFGALINSETGELIWSPENTVTSGSTVSFKVEVSDRRGGKEVQSFNIDVYSNLGKIQGAVFDDLNGNGFRDTTLVQGTNPNIVFAIDVSGSTGVRTVDWTKTDLNTFASSSYSILDMELATAIALSEQLILKGQGNSARISVVLWNTGAYILDMDPVQAGVQLFTTALADQNNNGISDLKEILNINTPGGGTNFTPGLIAADGVLKSLLGDPNLIFISDGYGGLDEDVVANIRASGTNLTAFGIGAGAGMAQLQKVDPNSVQITDVNELIDIFTGWDSQYSPEPFIENITVYLDLNDNGLLDLNEPWQLTKREQSVSTLGDSKYYYTFDNLLPGTYTVRQVVPEGYTQTAPSASSGFIDTVTVTGGEMFSHLFGLSKIAAPPNHDPVFRTTAPSPSLKLGEQLLYRAVAHDPDANPLTYDLPLAPEGMVIERETGNLIWTPKANQVGKFNVILRVKDNQGGFALQAFTGEVLPNNTAPLFTSTLPTSIKPQDSNLFQYQAKAIDADGDTLAYSLLTGAPNGMTIDAATGLLQWTPTAVGTQEATIKVTDGKGGETLKKLALTVNPAAANQAPTITSTPRSTVQLGSTFFYQVSASDAEGDRVSYSLETAPAGMTIQNGVISWTPTAAQSGTHPVSIKVSDGKSATTQTFSLTVAHQSVNYAPTITSVPNLVTNLEQTYVYNLVGNDPDGDRVFWSLEKAPSGMVIDAETGALRWQPQPGQIGTHQVLVKLTDTAGLESAQEFTLKVTGTNTPPAILSTPITRAAQGQAYSYTVVATDPENDPIAFSLGRRPEGMTIGPDGIIRWTPKSTQLGAQRVEVLATDSLGGTTTQRFTVEVGTAAINHAPKITSTPVFLAMPTQGYVYQVQASDTDAGDTLTYQLLDGPTGMTIDATTGKLEWATPAIGAHQVVVGAVDSKGVGAAQGFTLTVRQNHAPVITSTALETAMLGTTYRYDVRATDADGDRIFYRLDPASLAQGLSIDSLGRITWTPTTADLGQSYPVTITVTDEQGATQQQSFTLTVAQDTQAPTVTVFATQSLVDVGSTVTLIARATDNVRMANLTLMVGGQAVVLDANGRATLRVEQAGKLTAVAAAIDAAGNRSQATTTIQVIDPTAPFDPDLSFDLPEVVTAPTQFNVAGTGVVGYKLEVAPIAGGQWRTLTEKQGDIATDEKATFDPSLLENDTYLARLTLYGANGSVVFVEDTVSVAGELKLGNFRLSFTDLSIPVAGIPISLTRTYDSLTAYTTDDFGFGWRMEFRDTDLRTSLRRTEEQELVGIYPGFKDGTRVYITLPGGQRQGFTFKPTGDRLNQFFGAAPEAALYHPAFEADKGVTSTLTVKDVRITRGGTDQYAGLVGNPYNPADPMYGGIYVLTTQDGTVYEIDGQTGDLLTVTDTNGNRLTYTDESITSSSGQKITFERDAQHRITTVKDPMGELIRYTYDAMGDLVTVTDRQGSTTRLVYDAERQHYLKEIIDPLGRSGVKTEYDENGRLRKLLDVNGEAVGLVYDPANSQQTVKDVFGNPTTYVYDQHGNVVTEVDAVGKVTKRTYDASNNVLSEIIITDESGPQGWTTTYTYDAQGNQTSITDALGKTTYYSYGANSRLLSETDALGNTTTYAYDKRGNMLKVVDAAGNISEFSYSGSGNLLSLKDALGNSSQFGYSLKREVTSMTDAEGNTTRYEYDVSGNRTREIRTVTTPDGVQELVTVWTFDSENRIRTVTDSEGGVTTYEYDANGNQTALIDALGRRTEMRYDSRGQLIETLYADDTPDDLSDNPRTADLYDRGGRLRASIDQTGQVTHYVYDAVDRLVEVIHPDADETLEQLLAALAPSETIATVDWSQIVYPDAPLDYLSDNVRTRTEYTKDGRVKASIGERGNRTEYRYDALGRLVQTSYADATPDDLSDNPTTTVEYDAIGRRIADTDALGHTTRYRYDALGRVTETIFHNDSSTKVSYDVLGRRESVTDPAGKVTAYFYNPVGNLTGIQDAMGLLTQYRYDEVGRLIEIEDANGHITEYEYDPVGRRTAVILPLGQRSSSSYDAVGNLKSYADFNGEVTQYTYDVQNRIIFKDYKDDTDLSYTYTASGLVETITDGRGVTRFAYDAQNRLVSRTDPEGPYLSSGATIEYAYDQAGNRTAVITPSGSVNYTYDERNRLTTVIDADYGLTTYRYDDANNLIRTEFANDVTETREYDDLNRLVFLENRSSDTVLSSYRYELNESGHRLSVTEHDGRQVSYSYDDLYRLNEENIGNGERTIRYSYDSVGNRLTRDDLAKGLSSYIYDENDRLLIETLSLSGSVTSTTTYTYDDNGNLTERTKNGTETTRYVWNDDNRLVRAELPNGDVAEYVYDDEGIRVSSTVNGETTRYLIDKNQPYAQVLEEFSSDTLTAFYAYGLDLILQTRGEETSFYQVDGLGSTRVLTDELGAVTDRYVYDAFGNLSNSIGETENSYQYAGEQFDENLGGYYLRQRFYNTENGQFIRRDTYEGRPDEPLTLHKYLYANANPVNGIDPSGLSASFLEISAVQNILQTLSSIAAPSFVSIVTSVHARTLLSGLIITGATAAYNTASSALLKGEQLKLQKEITAAAAAAATTAAVCGIPLFHYTGYSKMLNIIVEQEIYASEAYKGGGFTHPVGAYATEIPPIGPFTKTELRMLYKSGDPSWDVSHFVMMCSNMNPFYKTGYPGEWVAPTLKSGFPVPVITALSGPNLMPS